MPETTLARTFADAIGAPFADAFRYQYAISETPLDLPEFEHKRLGTLHIYHSPVLPAIPLRSRDGQDIGLALGFPVTPDGVLLREHMQLDLHPSDPGAAKTLEAFAQALCGRFAILVDLATDKGRHARLYMDCIGALGAMYDPVSRICASSLLLTLTRDIAPHPQFRIPAAIYEIPEIAPLLPEPPADTELQTPCFGASYDATVRQLLANHCLDLSDFSMHRMPLPAPPETWLQPDEAAALIGDRLRSTLAALHGDATGYLAISGGMDSRMLVAAAPDRFGDGMTYYAYADNWITGVDMRLAEKLAERSDAPFLAQPPADDADGSFFPRERRAQYFRNRCAVSTGLKSLGDDWWGRGYFRQLRRGEMWVRGNALEVVTARLWTPTVDAPLRKGLRHALRRLSLDSEDRDLFSAMRQALLDWRTTLPQDWWPQFHDFWYQELFLSHSQPNFLGLNELAYFPPAADPAIFQAARSVEPGLRRTNVLYDAIIRHGRPDLAELPTTHDITRDIKTTGLDLETVISLYM